MRYYGAIDLHSTNSYVVIIDEAERVLFSHALANDADLICRVFAPYREALSGIAVESTYNWYWLVDALMAAGHRVHLANPAAMRQYEGLKYSDDRTDALWLARLLRLGILPEGYIYPRAERGLRDLLRRRGQLVSQHTANLLSVQNQLARSAGLRLRGEEVKRLSGDALAGLVGDELVCRSIAANLAVMAGLRGEIEELERLALQRARPAPAFAPLLSVSGVGRILALTIMLETGDIGRFAGPGNFASYCRCVASTRISNARKKGEGNRRCGNRHLAWAFVEAGHYAIRFEPRAKRFYERKKARRNAIVARKAVAHKLARASYHVMRDQVSFSAERCFG